MGIGDGTGEGGGEDLEETGLEDVEDLPLTLLIQMEGGGLENLAPAEMRVVAGGDSPATTFIAGVIVVT